ncbi:MAG: hypothetical protein BWY25_02468 [Chloroflexi bacterium ADurb.Bin222]|nr:MAG: hypothetical protein BWY25_02468 [Chloroflexi bacterium ADurb.Bin222]
MTTDIDGQPRPLGNGPDVGADESPYSANINGVQVSTLASPPEWRVYYTGVGVPPSTYLQQEYLIPFAYYAPPTAPQVRSYTLQDRFPADLELVSTTNPAGLRFNQEGVTLTWTSQTPLLPGEWSWVGLTGRSGDIAGGASLLNTGSLSYTLANEVHGTLPFSATTVVPARPVFPPLFLTPGDGEICVNESSSLRATGLAGAGMLVRLYEDNTYKASATASATGQFTITWTSALTESHPLVFIYAESCETGAGGACSGPSDVVRLEYPEGHWCPQRSYWEGEAQGIHHTFYFRNDLGRYATDDFALPGVYGFWNTQMHLYSCCAYNELNPFKVRADGQLYDEPVAHNGRMWTFNIGSAHEVTIETQCFGPGGEPGEPIVTHGEVQPHHGHLRAGAGAARHHGDRLRLRAGMGRVDSVARAPVPEPNQPAGDRSQRLLRLLHAAGLLLSGGAGRGRLSILAQPGRAGDQRNRAREHSAHPLAG